MLKAAGDVTLTADVTAIGETIVSWKQTSGPDVSITDADKVTAKVSISAVGTYGFEVTVTNKDGYASSFYAVTVTFNKDTEDVKTLLNAGILALEKKDFDLALTKFEAAYFSDKTSSDATFWYAFMSMLSISTDPNTVGLMKNRIGFASYPTSMNQVLSDKWFNQTYYNSYQGFVPATENSSSWYVWGIFHSDFGW